MIKTTKSKTEKKAPIYAVSFDDTVLVKRLLAEVPDRARDVLIRRFGLGTSSTRETLESIGNRSGITRERVRQIEAVGLEAVRKSKTFQEAGKSFEELRVHIEKLGGILPEDELLLGLGKDQKQRNRFRFLLIVGAVFFRERETNDFYARWHVDDGTSKKVHEALSKLYGSLKDTEVLGESEFLDRFLEELKDVNDAYRNEEVLKRWLSLSKCIDCNPLSEWGKATAPVVRTKGVRDYAYLAIKRNGKPMHFSDVAKTITSMFAKKAHVATTHNELIKDSRFVLVGRGLYALSEWGYTPGVVRDVIREVIVREGPMVKEDVIEMVKKVRLVKDNTIIVNLNDPKYFKRMKDGRYSVA